MPEKQSRSEGKNTTVFVTKQPKGGKIDTSFFQVVVSDQPIPSRAQLKSNQVLMHVRYLSVDPYLRYRMSDDNTTIPRLNPNEPMNGIASGIVADSTSGQYQVGDPVVCLFADWTEYMVIDLNDIQSESTQTLKKVPEAMKGLPLEWHVTLLGMPSFTSWYGLFKVGQPKKGDTLVVSAATGAVGQSVCQLGKALGLRVVGIAGNEDKIRYLTEKLGVDETINYKTTKDMQAALEKACPNGIDVYYDNVGGHILDCVLMAINPGGRIVVCGQISQYQVETGQKYGIKNLDKVLWKTLEVKGFVIFNHYEECYDEFVRDITQRHKAGSFVYKTDEYRGLDKAPQAMVDMLEGRNFGKTFVKVE
ncbi:hypothetical protein H4R35_002767 [Dimargaris xerosporica]|nr:hypothetical protein H4R35_002767 [Dimargaris xerosporica]